MAGTGGGEGAEGDGGYAAVEEEGVGVGDVEGAVGLVVEHTGVHGGGFGEGYVGRIAYDEVEGAGGRCVGEDILAEEVDAGMETGGVAARHGKGPFGDIEGRDPREREITAERQG